MCYDDYSQSSSGPNTDRAHCVLFTRKSAVLAAVGTQIKIPNGVYRGKWSKQRGVFFMFRSCFLFVLFF